MSFNPGRISKADATAYSSSSSDDDDDDEYLQPSANPQADEFFDLNPRKRRRTGRNAKESAALGIFGSDSEDDGPGKRWKSKKDLRHKNVAFVSAGQEDLNQNLNDESIEDDKGHDEDEDEDEDEESSSHPGLGAKPSHSTMQEDSDEEDEDEDMT
ncbi:hypothetical protein PC116_g33564, partial [Phytophthora cactorum]